LGSKAGRQPSYLNSDLLESSIRGSQRFIGQDGVGSLRMDETEEESESGDSDDNKYEVCFVV